jgi:hypothetical protein
MTPGARAGEVSILDNILGPEGPLFVEGSLYYVGWVSHTLSKWDGKPATVLNHTASARVPCVQPMSV